MAFAFRAEFDVLENDRLRLEAFMKRDGIEVELPFYWYRIYRKPEMTPVGNVSIRIGENYHSYYNGHIGYEIDPAYRGRGLAGDAARMVLSVAKAYGMDHAILTCNEDNVASYRTIERLGAKLLEIADVPADYFAWYEGIPRHRIYRLDF